MLLDTIDFKRRNGIMVCYCLGPFPFKNMAIRNRILYLTEKFDLLLLCLEAGDMKDEIELRGGEVKELPLNIKSQYTRMALYLIWAFLMTFWVWIRSSQSFRFVYSSQDITILPASMARACPGCRLWIADILDDPALEHKNWMGREVNAIAGRIIRKTLTFIEVLKRIVLKHADLIVAQGKSSKSSIPMLLKTDYKIREENLICVPNGVNLKLIRPAIEKSERSGKQNFVIFYVGYVSQLRGIGTVLKAVSLLRQKMEDVELRLVGWTKPQDEQWLHHEIKSLNLEDVVEYLGVQPSEKVWMYIEQSDVCIFPFERSEIAYVIPVKIFEYLALKKPVIASDLEGVRLVIEDGFNGILVPPGNEEKWAEAFFRIAFDRSLRKKLIANSRDSVKIFDWNIINGKIFQAIMNKIELF